MLHTACATTATATTWSPCSMPPLRGPVSAAAPRAKRTMATADGSVKPSQAASPPASPPRERPTAKPTWLLAGPGSSWHRATRSA